MMIHDVKIDIRDDPILQTPLRNHQGPPSMTMLLVHFQS